MLSNILVAIIVIAALAYAGYRLVRRPASGCGCGCSSALQKSGCACSSGHTGGHSGKGGCAGCGH